MDQHVVVGDFEPNNFGLLVLVNVLSENVRTLRVSLTPLFCLSIEELETQDTLSNLVHNVDPEKSLNFIICKTKELVDFW